jgi:hypothetical protein
VCSSGVLKPAYCKNCDARNNGNNGQCTTESECTNSLGKIH